MRPHLPLVLISLLASVPAAALDLPPRKAGLWDIKMNLEGRNLPVTGMQQCVDAETDKLMNSIGGSMREACSKQDMQKVGNTIVVDSVCKIGEATTTSHGVITGDFNSAYTVKVTSKHTGGPAIPGRPADGTTTMTIEAKWMGACKPDQKPGDIIMSTGMKMNIRDMQNLPGRTPGGPPAKK
jgi:hypothetical protein